MVPVILDVEDEGEGGEHGDGERVVLQPRGQQLNVKLAHQKDSLLDFGLKQNFIGFYLK